MPGRTHSVEVGGERISVDVGETGELRVGGAAGGWTVTPAQDGACLVSQGDARHRVFVAAGADGRVQVFVEGEFYDVRVERDGGSKRGAARAHVEPLTVPMPARVVKILVSEGAAVKRGDTLVTLEAMKMELPLKAPRDGIVRSLACREGELVQPATALVELA